MSERCVGVVVTGDTVKIVSAEIPDDDDEPIGIIGDDSWRLQDGGHPDAYDVMYRRFAGFLKENKVERAIIKASELAGSTKLAHLESAELRGVIIAAAACACDVKLLKKSVVSKTYGKRKVDEYLKDDAFWDEQVTGSLRKTSREAAMILVASRSAK